MVYGSGIENDPTQSVPIYGDYILHNEEEQTKQAASKPKQINNHTKPSPQEVAERNLTHLPTEIGARNFDYAFIKGHKHPYKATVLTMCETTTGLGYAAVVQKKPAVYDAIQAIKKFIVENGLQDYTTTIRQQSIDQETTERYHQLFAAENYEVSVLQGLQHRQYQHQFTQLTTQRYGTSAWVLNRFLRHADGKTSREEYWKREYNTSCLHLDLTRRSQLLAENMKVLVNFARGARNKSAKPFG
eukprot:3746350-Amphidinium_carterae.2